MALSLAFLALLVERIFGYPERLLRVIGHPVMWIGRLIAFLDEHLNRKRFSPPERRFMGAVALVVTAGLAASAGLALHSLFGGSFLGLVILALIASSLLAQKSLESHVASVAESLEKEGLPGGRRAVAKIVGRDPDSLDEPGVARAAIESLAENFSDGVVAPAFWLAILGLPGAAAYKAINTADSMIGHPSERHRDFGWASARLDDLVNLPASRLSAALIAAAAIFVPDADPGAAWQAARRDAPRHRSPNAGWPEAAIAGALGLALAGPRRYGGVLVEDHVMGQGGRREADAGDIRRALALYRVADFLLIGLVALLALLIGRW
jgi:adenosylcobinamide-phosphate synthase